MRRLWPRIVSLLGAAVFALTMLIPAAAFAAPAAREAECWISAECGSGTISNALDEKSEGKFTQVPLGAAVTLKLGPDESWTDPVVWSSEPSEGTTWPDEKSTSSIEVVPFERPANGVITYTARSGDLEASFGLKVVDQMQWAPGTKKEVRPGEEVKLSAVWPEGTASPELLRYSWDALDNSKELDNTQGPEAELNVPADAAPGTVYKYQVKPYSTETGDDLKYKALDITLTVQAEPSPSEEPDPSDKPGGDNEPGDNNPSGSPDQSESPSASESPDQSDEPDSITGTGSNVTWYVGSTTSPVLTASFSADIVSASWKCAQLSAEPVYVDTEVSGSTASYTVPAEISSTWKAGDIYTYTCTGTTALGGKANVTISVIVSSPKAPQIQGSVSVNDTVYEESAVGQVCRVNALAAAPPTLTAKASGGNAASRADSPYTFQWYKCDSAQYSVSGEPLGGTTVSEDGTSCSLPLSAGLLASEANGTAYFACVVSQTGNSSEAARAQQNFAVTTVERAQLEKNDGSGDDNEMVPPNENLSLEKTVQWNPPVEPGDLEDYTWTLEEAPADGEVTVDTGSGQTTLKKGQSVSMSRTRQSIRVMRFSLTGRYRLVCTPRTTSGASYGSVTFRFNCGKTILSQGLVTYAGTAGGGSAEIAASAPVSNNTVSVPANGRFSFNIPSKYIDDSQSLIMQWLVRRSSTSVPEFIPVNMGFYGVNSNTLVSGPVTAAMNGWQFCLKVYYVSAPDASEQSQWITLNVTGSGTGDNAATPVIVQPEGSVIYEGGQSGQTLSLMCRAYVPNGETMTYQWQTSSGASGPWSDISAQTSAELRLSGLSDSNNGQYYRCTVISAKSGRTAVSKPYMVSVWAPSSVPTVTMSPENTTYAVADSTSTDYTLRLVSTASLSSGSALQAQWQYRPANGTWQNVPDEDSFGSSISGPVTTGGTSTLSLAANKALCAPSGEYRCVWIAGQQSPNSPLLPQSNSAAAVVEITYPGFPRIISQPQSASVNVGSAASFTVSANLVPPAAADDSVVYIWQVSRDGGITWSNCTDSADGIGQFTGTFRTNPVTQDMYQQYAAAAQSNTQNSIFQYRCIIANRRLNVNVVSAAASLRIQSGQSAAQAITPGSGSNLSISASGDTRYLSGLDATANGTVLETLIADLKYQPPEGYALRCIAQDGNAVPNTSVVCTGMKLELVNTAGNSTADSVIVVVRGDVLGTGKMSLSQIVRLARAFTGQQPLTGAFERAGLLKENGDAITLTDLVMAAQMYKKSRG